MIKAILFDLDETLFDRTGSLKLFLQDQYKRHEALAHVPVDDFITMFLTLDARGSQPQAGTYAALLGHLGQVDDTLVSTMHAEYEDGFRQFATMVPGTDELLLYLRQKGLRTGIISNGRTDHQMASSRMRGVMTGDWRVMREMRRGLGAFIEGISPVTGEPLRFAPR